MVNFIDIKVTGLKETQNYLSSLDARVSRAVEIDISNIATDFKRGLKDEIVSQNLIFRKDLFNSVRKRKRKDKQFVVTMNREGVWLDRMRPHFAPLADPVLSEWLERNQNGTSGKRPGKAGYIWVRPHPWIEKGLQRARKKINKRLAKGKVARVFNKRGV